MYEYFAAKPNISLLIRIQNFSMILPFRSQILSHICDNCHHYFRASWKDLRCKSEHATRNNHVYKKCANVDGGGGDDDGNKIVASHKCRIFHFITNVHMNQIKRALHFTAYGNACRATKSVAKGGNANPFENYCFPMHSHWIFLAQNVLQFKQTIHNFSEIHKVHMESEALHSGIGKTFS